MNENDYTLGRLIDFMDYLGSSGLMKIETARARRTACERILVDLSPDEQQDVRKVDLEAAAKKFGNKNHVAPRTIQEYRRRIQAAIADLVKYTENPESFKPKGRARQQRKPAADPKVKNDTPLEIRQGEVAKEAAPRTTATTLQIPVRSDFVAQLVLPYDLTAAEAKRLCKLIEALPIEQEK